MTINDYQSEALRTMSDLNHGGPTMIENAALGLCGESGEVADIVKKALFQGHELDGKHIAKELGQAARTLNCKEEQNQMDENQFNRKNRRSRHITYEERQLVPLLLAMEDEEQLRLLDYRRAAVLRQMRNATTPRERECLRLYYAQRMTLSEVGAATGTVASTISRNISRGRQKMSAILAGARVLMGEDFMR